MCSMVTSTNAPGDKEYNKLIVPISCCLSAHHCTYTENPLKSAEIAVKEDHKLLHVHHISFILTIFFHTFVQIANASLFQQL